MITPWNRKLFTLLLFSFALLWPLHARADKMFPNGYPPNYPYGHDGDPSATPPHPDGYDGTPGDATNPNGGVGGNAAPGSNGQGGKGGDAAPSGTGGTGGNGDGTAKGATVAEAVTKLLQQTLETAAKAARAVPAVEKAGRVVVKFCVRKIRSTAPSALAKKDLAGA